MASDRQRALEVVVIGLMQLGGSEQVIVITLGCIGIEQGEAEETLARLYAERERVQARGH